MRIMVDHTETGAGGRRGTVRGRRIRRLAAAGLVVAAGAALAACPGAPSSKPKLSAAHARGTSTTTTSAVPATPPPARSGFSPLSVTFVSAELGWVLGLVPYGAGSQLAVARTTDGGATWSRSPAPEVTFGAGAQVVGAIIRFADPADGWIAAPPAASTGWFPSALWSTHDGGASWQEVPVPGGGGVVALEASADAVQLVTFGPSGPSMQLYSVPASSDAWVAAATSVPIGAGPVARAQLVLHGSAGWMLENDRTVVAGARLTSGAWVHWTPPCTDALGTAAVAASSTADLVAVCNEGVWGSPPAGLTRGPWLFTSADGGGHFAVAGEIATSTGADVQTAASVTAPPGHPQVVVVGGVGLVATFDGGRTWRTVYSTAAGREVRFVGFTTATQGVAIVTGGAGISTLLMTRDGGAVWSPVTLSATGAP
jgi:photosystem II stability/assembly factor-like uncharacterized protein